MSNESEIAALIALLDDSDQEVFDHVAARLIALGPMVIDKLEDAYTSIPNPVMQERIEIENQGMKDRHAQLGGNPVAAAADLGQ